MGIRLMKNLFLTLLLISCAKPTVEPVEPVSDRLPEVQEKLVELFEEGIAIADTKNTWLIADSCDSMMWSSLFGSQLEGYFKYELAEDKEISGKYYRTQDQDCFADARSGSTWSRDMALAFLVYLYSQGDLGAIEAHIAFGESQGWIMGEGARTRTIYSPALIGLWYKAAKSLGHDYGVIIVQNEYSAGKVDYQANLQMLDIYLNGIIDGAITETMLARVLEHSDRDSDSRFFHILRGIYQGPIEPAIDICLDDDERIGSHVRCDGEQCELADRVFACGILTKYLYEKG